MEIFLNIHCIGNVDVDQGISTSEIDAIDDNDLSQVFAVSNQGMLCFQFNTSWFLFKFVFITYVHLRIAGLRASQIHIA